MRLHLIGSSRKEKGCQFPFLDAHNRLLTGFPRKPEYYNGILFLTTNRAIEFDDAILSRMHLKIRYDGLTKESRRDIWAHFLSKARISEGPSIIKNDELQDLASIALNGREVRKEHICDTASSQYRMLTTLLRLKISFPSPMHLPRPINSKSLTIIRKRLQNQTRSLQRLYT